MLQRPVQIIVLGIIVLFTLINTESAFAQLEFDVNATTPCFLNYTASYNMLENCNADGDYMAWILMTWEWITGGYFGMIVISLIVGAVYIKYREAILAFYTGLILLPISYFLFPDVFLSYAVIMGFVAVGILIWYVIIRQTE